MLTNKFEMALKVLRYLAVLTLLTNYILATLLLFDIAFSESENIIWWIWASGIINVILVTVYFFKSSSQKKIWVAITVILTGITWVFPPLLFTYFGIPFSIIYFFISIYILTQPLNVSITSVSSGLG